MARAKTSRRRKQAPEIIDFFARIERGALRYGINHYHHKHDAPRPYSRTLHLYGRMLHPDALRGMALEVWLIGKADLVEEPTETLHPIVADLQKRGAEIVMSALVPIEYITTLSQAFHDGRLQIVAARGPALRRGSSLLTDLSFEELRSFEDNWGAALPSLD